MHDQQTSEQQQQQNISLKEIKRLHRLHRKQSSVIQRAIGKLRNTRDNLARKLSRGGDGPGKTAAPWDEDDTKYSEQQNSVASWDLFRYAQRSELATLLLGILCMVYAASWQPISVFILAIMASLMGHYSKRVDLLHQLSQSSTSGGGGGASDGGVSSNESIIVAGYGGGGSSESMTTQSSSSIANTAGGSPILMSLSETVRVLTAPTMPGATHGSGTAGGGGASGGSMVSAYEDYSFLGPIHALVGPIFELISGGGGPGNHWAQQQQQQQQLPAQINNTTGTQGPLVDIVDGGGVDPIEEAMRDLLARESSQFLRKSFEINASAFLLALTQLLAFFAGLTLIQWVARRQASRIKILYFNSCLHQEVTWFEAIDSASGSASSLNGLVEKYEEGIGMKLALLCYFLGHVSLFAATAFYRMASLATFCMPFVLIVGLIIAWLSDWQAHAFGQQALFAKRSLQLAEEILAAIRTVFAFNGQQKEIARYEASLEPVYGKSLTKHLYTALNTSLSKFSIFACFAAYCFYAKHLFPPYSEHANSSNKATILAVMRGAEVSIVNILISIPFMEALQQAKGSIARIFVAIERRSRIDASNKQGLRPDSMGCFCGSCGCSSSGEQCGEAIGAGGRRWTPSISFNMVQFGYAHRSGPTRRRSFLPFLNLAGSPGSCPPRASQQHETPPPSGANSVAVSVTPTQRNNSNNDNNNNNKATTATANNSAAPLPLTASAASTRQQNTKAMNSPQATTTTTTQSRLDEQQQQQQQQFSNPMGALPSSRRRASILEEARTFAKTPMASASGSLKPQVVTRRNSAIVRQMLSNELARSRASDAHILNCFTLHIEAGQTVALVGPSGSGKSTVLALVQRLYDTTGGTIHIGKHNIRDLNVGWLRNQIGLVGQEPRLFDMSIAENIMLGLRSYHTPDYGAQVSSQTSGCGSCGCGGGCAESPGAAEQATAARGHLRAPLIKLLEWLRSRRAGSIRRTSQPNNHHAHNHNQCCNDQCCTTNGNGDHHHDHTGIGGDELDRAKRDARVMQQVVEAARAAGAHDFIRKLPNGYATRVGSAGVQLSGGQKQRIAIARALIRKPAILLLDECTSALDSESEAQVQAALRSVATGGSSNSGGGQPRTTLIVAHRLETIKHVDLIVVMNQGQVVECGTHAQLMQADPRQQQQQQQHGEGAASYRQLYEEQARSSSSSSPSLSLGPAPHPKATSPAALAPLAEKGAGADLAGRAGFALAPPIGRGAGDSHGLVGDKDQPLGKGNAKATPTTTSCEGDGRGEDNGANTAAAEAEAAVAAIAAAASGRQKYGAEEVDDDDDDDDNQDEEEDDGGTEEEEDDASSDSSLGRPRSKASAWQLWRFIAMPKWTALAALIVCLLAGLVLPLNLIAHSYLFSVFAYRELDQIGEYLHVFGLLILSFSTFVFIISFLQVLLPGYVGERMAIRLRVKTMESLLAKPMFYFDMETNSAGALCDRFNSHIGALQQIAGSRVATMLEALATLIAGAFFGFGQNLALSLFCLSFALLVLITTILESKLVAREMALQRRYDSQLAHLMADALANIKTIASLNKERYFIQRFRAIIGRRERGVGAGRQCLRSLLTSLKFVMPAMSWSASMYYGCLMLTEGRIDLQTIFIVCPVVLFAVNDTFRALVFLPELLKARRSLARLHTMNGEFSPKALAALTFGQQLEQQNRLHLEQVVAESTSPGGGTPANLIVPVRRNSQAQEVAVDTQTTVAGSLCVPDGTHSHLGPTCEGSEQQAGKKKRSISFAPDVLAPQAGEAGGGQQLQLQQNINLSQTQTQIGGPINRRLSNLANLPSYMRRKSSRLNSLVPRVSARGRIEFKDVEFAYPNRPTCLALDGFSLRVEPGESVALVGSSGSGKSTTVALLEKFYDYHGGQILLEGRDLRLVEPNWVRSQIGLVQQEPCLLSYTIGDNIRYGDNSRFVAMEEVVEAARTANIHDFIMSLPDKYETQLSSSAFSSSQLSGGQRQRIAIARALVRQAPILIFDEATSALDARSETLVQDALNKARRGRTCLAIAHRLSTIKDADKIVVLREGRVVEWGRHEQLLAKRDGYYRALWLRQEGVSPSSPTSDNQDEMLAATASNEGGGGARREK